ncbi:hypothetical protein BKA82DRAFT_118534, partial [Pisolithus tinctorius]
TTLQKAKSFLDVMIKGHPEYGCMISKEKTVTNFDYGTEIMNITSATQTRAYMIASFPRRGRRA